MPREEELSPRGLAPYVKNGPLVTGYLKTSWDDVRKPNCERRETKVSGYYSVRNGHSTVEVTCPFCGTDHQVYLWSFAGCGRRCDVCGAIMGQLYAARLMKKEKPEPKPEPKRGTGKPRATLTGIDYNKI